MAVLPEHFSGLTRQKFGTTFREHSQSKRLRPCSCRFEAEQTAPKRVGLDGKAHLLLYGGREVLSC
jgi:hypothetical protein